MKYKVTSIERKRIRIKDERAPRVVLKTLNPGARAIPLFSIFRINNLIIRTFEISKNE